MSNRKRRRRNIPEYCKGCVHEYEQQCEFRLSCPYFQADLKKRRKTVCDDCPYGKGIQCVGFCIKAILSGKSSRDFHGGYDVIRSDRTTAESKADGSPDIPAA